LQTKVAGSEAERRAVAAGGIGIDWGVAQPLALSDGTVIELPRVSAAEQAQLAVLQQRVSRKRLGSANRRKEVAQLNRFLRQIRCRRLDALHKVTTGLAKNHRLLVIEELQIQNVTASARGTVEVPGSKVTRKAELNRAILDLSPARFWRLLTDKCERYGATLPAYHASRESSCCGEVDRRNRPTQARFARVACGHAEPPTSTPPGSS